MPLERGGGGDADRLTAMPVFAPPGQRPGASVLKRANLPRPLRDCYATLSAAA